MLQWRIGWNIPIKVDSKRKYNLRGGGELYMAYGFFFSYSTICRVQHEQELHLFRSEANGVA